MMGSRPRLLWLWYMSLRAQGASAKGQSGFCVAESGAQAEQRNSIITTTSAPCSRYSTRTPRFGALGRHSEIDITRGKDHAWDLLIFAVSDACRFSLQVSSFCLDGRSRPALFAIASWPITNVENGPQQISMLHTLPRSRIMGPMLCREIRSCPDRTCPWRNVTVQ